MEREALKLALDALEVATTPLAKDRQEVLRAQAALRQAIEQAEKQEPAQRTWVEPTGNEWFKCWLTLHAADETEAEFDFADFLIIAQAVVAKLKEKNT